MWRESIRHRASLLLGGYAGDFFERLLAHAERVADPLFGLDIAPIEVWVQTGSGREVGLACHDAEATRQARHAFAVGPMRFLFSTLDQIEHLFRSHVQNW